MRFKLFALCLTLVALSVKRRPFVCDRCSFLGERLRFGPKKLVLLAKPVTLPYESRAFLDKRRLFHGKSLRQRFGIGSQPLVLPTKLVALFTKSGVLIFKVASLTL